MAAWTCPDCRRRFARRGQGHERRGVRHPLITRKVIPHAGRYFHVVRLTGPDDLDDEIVGWLTEAYHQTPA